MKKWYLSKILWVNFIAIIAIIAQAYTTEVISLEIQASVLAMVNIALRMITNEGLTK